MLSLPNILTLSRILFIPIYINFFLNGDYIIAGSIFAFSAITDFLDGYIARKYNLTSKLGRILDPLADKLTIISILLVLIFSSIIPKVIAIILLTREIFIMFSSSIVYLMGIDVINPSYLGKLSIAILYVSIIARLLKINYFNIDMVLLYVVLPLNIISGIDYIITTARKVRT